MASEPSASGKNLDLADRSSFIDRFEIVLNDLDVALFYAISDQAAHKSEARHVRQILPSRQSYCASAISFSNSLQATQ